MHEAKCEDRGRHLALIVGAVISVAAYGATGWLGLKGHDIVAVSIALPLTTVLAMVVGNRFLH